MCCLTRGVTFHRKQCVAETEQFDFLEEIVAAANEAPRGRKGRGGEQANDEADEAEAEADEPDDEADDAEDDEDDDEPAARPPAKKQRAPPPAPTPAPAAGVVSVRSLLNSSDGHS
jgi:hypothetical protein